MSADSSPSAVGMRLVAGVLALGATLTGIGAVREFLAIPASPALRSHEPVGGLALLHALFVFPLATIAFVHLVRHRPLRGEAAWIARVVGWAVLVAVSNVVFDDHASQEDPWILVIAAATGIVPLLPMTTAAVALDLVVALRRIAAPESPPMPITPFEGAFAAFAAWVPVALIALGEFGAAFDERHATRFEALAQGCTLIAMMTAPFALFAGVLGLLGGGFSLLRTAIVLLR